MPYFEKVVGEDGTETFVEVEPLKLEVPDEHPLSLKLKDAREDAAKKRLKARDLKRELDALQAEESADNPAETVDPKLEVPVTLDPAEFARQVNAQLQLQQQEASSAAAARKAIIDSIMKDTGLPAELRGTIEAISDPVVAREQALTLSKFAAPFEEAAGGGNGSATDMSSVYSKANEALFGKPELPQ